MPALVPQVRIRMPKYFVVGVPFAVELLLRNPHATDGLANLTVECVDGDGVRQCKEIRSLPGQGQAGVTLRLEPQAFGRHSCWLSVAFNPSQMIRNRVKWPFTMLVLSRGEVPGVVNVTVAQGNQGSGEATGRLGSVAVSAGTSENVVHINASPVESANRLLEDAYRETDFIDLPVPPDAEIGFDPIAFENTMGMRLEPMAAGGFIQGSPRSERAAGRADDEMERDVRLTQPFWMGAHEVSQRAWKKIMGNFPGKDYLGDELPAHSITWDEAREFCRKLTAAEHKTAALPPALEYRLPTEAEWEYGCRAGTREARYGPLQEIAWVNQTGLQPRGMLKPNSWGLYDMLGNCFEWCLDSYQPIYRRDSVEALDPFAFDPDAPKVVRGGCFQHGPEYARAAARTKVPADKRSARISFRPVVAFRDGNPLHSHPLFQSTA